jgi:hypothetical protein
MTKISLVEYSFTAHRYAAVALPAVCGRASRRSIGAAGAG